MDYEYGTAGTIIKSSQFADRNRRNHGHSTSKSME